MPVLYDEQIFGWKNTPNIDVALPVRFADRKRSPYSWRAVIVNLTNSNRSMRNRRDNRRTTSQSQLARHLGCCCDGCGPVREDWKVWCFVWYRYESLFCWRVVHTDIWSQLASQSLRSESRTMLLELCRMLRQRLGRNSYFCNTKSRLQRSYSMNLLQYSVMPQCSHARTSESILANLVCSWKVGYVVAVVLA